MNKHNIKNNIVKGMVFFFKNPSFKSKKLVSNTIRLTFHGPVDPRDDRRCG